jgi:hypothetical protein
MADCKSLPIQSDANFSISTGKPTTTMSFRMRRIIVRISGEESSDALDREMGMLTVYYIVRLSG